MRPVAATCLTAGTARKVKRGTCGHAERSASTQQAARGVSDKRCKTREARGLGHAGWGARAGARALVLAGGEELDLRVALDREVQVHA